MQLFSYSLRGRYDGPDGTPWWGMLDRAGLGIIDLGRRLDDVVEVSVPEFGVVRNTVADEFPSGSDHRTPEPR